MKLPPVTSPKVSGREVSPLTAQGPQALAPSPKREAPQESLVRSQESLVSLLPTPVLSESERKGALTAIRALQQVPLGRTFAAIDLGSSSGKMLVAKQTAKGLEIVVDKKIGCALGKDTANGQPIPAANMDRAIAALKEFVAVADAHGVSVTDIPLITTAVVRNANNGADFVARVKDEVGLQAKVLSGQEEASVGFQGALGALLKEPGRYATLDLGGGSFQLATGTEKGLEQGESTQLGSNAILDDMINPRTGADGVINDAVFAYVDQQIKARGPMPMPVTELEGRTLVATGGVSKFLRIQLGKDTIARDEIDALRRQLGALPIAERAAFVAIGKSDADKTALGIDTSPGAADYGKKLPASLSLLLHIVDSIGLAEVTVSSTDARHALLHMAAS